MKFSLIPLLFAIQVLAIYFAARHAKRQQQLTSITWISFLLAILIVWGGVSTWFGLTGFYLSKNFLNMYPTLWLPFIPVVLVMTFLIFSSPARKAVNGLIDATPIKWLIGIHILRILAIGTLIKAYNDEFSHQFALWVGIPDMLFGMSALVMFRLATQNRVSTMVLMVWNFIGVLVILPAASIIAQMQLPGWFFTHQATPSMTTLYEFPMVLAPTLVVPIFVMINLLVVGNLIEKLVRSTGTSKK